MTIDMQTTEMNNLKVFNRRGKIIFSLLPSLGGLFLDDRKL